MHVFAAVTTSSPGSTPTAWSATVSASVPDATPIACARAQELRELVFELLDLLTEDELTARPARDRSQSGAPDATAPSHAADRGTGPPLISPSSASRVPGSTPVCARDSLAHVDRRPPAEVSFDRRVISVEVADVDLLRDRRGTARGGTTRLPASSISDLGELEQRDVADAAEVVDATVCSSRAAASTNASTASSTNVRSRRCEPSPKIRISHALECEPEPHPEERLACVPHPHPRPERVRQTKRSRPHPVDLARTGGGTTRRRSC